jgi:hypothetical protein
VPDVAKCVLVLDFVDQLAELFDRDVGQLLSPLIESFGDPNDCLTHQEVGLLGASGQEKILAAGDSFVAVVRVESEAQQAGDATFFRKSMG